MFTSSGSSNEHNFEVYVIMKYFRASSRTHPTYRTDIYLAPPTQFLMIMYEYHSKGVFITIKICVVRNYSLHSSSSMELVATKPGSDIQTLKKYSNINKTQFIACDIKYQIWKYRISYLTVAWNFLRLIVAWIFAYF